MKTLGRLIKTCLAVFFMLAFSSNVQGQLLKKLGKRAEKAAERAVERRVEKETTEKTEEVLDSILEPSKKGGETESPVPEVTEPNVETPKPQDGNDSESPSPAPEKVENSTITVYSKFDYVPGDKLLFFDDFTDDFIGDFPSKWNTNGSG